MKDITYILICHFGLEKVLKNEIKRLGLGITNVTDGEIRALGSIEDIPRLNFNLRTAERVMIEISEFKATTFEELFQGILNSEIEKYVPVDGAFPITKANQDKNSILHSSTAIQSIVKKAMVERLKKAYKTNLLSEDKGKYPFRLKMYKNVASLRLDTTGDSLHKRGYRIKSGIAPIEETLAAALIKVTGFADKFKENRKGDKNDDILIDAFCGSGTIPIEAAMIAANMPVSIDRAFVSETWGNVLSRAVWENAKKEAFDKINIERKNNKEIKIFGFDIDANMIRIARENAIRAGVDKMIYFETLDVKDLTEAQVLRNIKNKKEKLILSNPPYGERMEDKDKIVSIYQNLKKSYDKMDGYELHLITSFEDTEKILGKSDKNRKLYNGMLKTYFYSYY